MVTVRLRSCAFVALSLLCLTHAARAAVVESGPLDHALGMMQSVPGFRTAVLSQITAIGALSAQSAPTMAPLLAAAPAASDPWRAEAARFVGALAAQPRVVASHQAQLRAALGAQEADSLLKASSRLQASAAQHAELRAQLESLRSGLDVGAPDSVREFNSRLNAMFENSRSGPAASAQGSVAAGETERKQEKMPGAWKLKPAPRFTYAEEGVERVEGVLDESGEPLDRRFHVAERGIRRWMTVTLLASAYNQEFDEVAKQVCAAAGGTPVATTPRNARQTRNMEVDTFLNPLTLRYRVSLKRYFRCEDAAGRLIPVPH